MAFSWKVPVKNQDLMVQDIAEATEALNSARNLVASHFKRFGEMDRVLDNIDTALTNIKQFGSSIETVSIFNTDGALESLMKTTLDMATLENMTGDQFKALEAGLIGHLAGAVGDVLKEAKGLVSKAFAAIKHLLQRLWWHLNAIISGDKAHYESLLKADAWLQKNSGPKQTAEEMVAEAELNAKTGMVEIEPTRWENFKAALKTVATLGGKKKEEPQAPKKPEWDTQSLEIKGIGPSSGFLTRQDADKLLDMLRDRQKNSKIKMLSSVVDGMLGKALTHEDIQKVEGEINAAWVKYQSELKGMLESAGIKVVKLEMDPETKNIDGEIVVNQKVGKLGQLGWSLKEVVSFAKRFVVSFGSNASEDTLSKEIGRLEGEIERIRCDENVSVEDKKAVHKIFRTVISVANAECTMTSRIMNELVRANKVCMQLAAKLGICVNV